MEFSIMEAARQAAFNYLIEKLDAAIGKYQPSGHYTITGGFDDYDYCDKCVEIASNEVHANFPDNMAFVDARLEKEEQEEMARCHKCGCLLSSTLSEEGAIRFIKEFIDAEHHFGSPLLPSEAYMVRAVLIPIQHGHEASPLDDRNAITLGEIAVSLINAKPDVQLDLFGGLDDPPATPTGDP